MLYDEVATAVSGALARHDPELAGADPLVRRSDHGDFQSNAALGLAKRTGTRPVELAKALLTHLGPDFRLSGPGFLVATLPSATVWRTVATPGPVGAPLAGRRVVIDYSAPNVAKEMHVGHLRGTVIGDCLARVHAFLGADVVRQNHLGDWGTQFGMLIQYQDEHDDRVPLDDLYRAARALFDADGDFADRARRRVVALQSGEPGTLARWRSIVAESEAAFGAVYARLGVLLTADDSVGESFYNPMLTDTVTDLVDAGIAVPSEGAIVIHSDNAPLMLRKSDGGFGYDTTDLAAIRYRVRTMRPDELLYVTDSRQAQHFAQVFAAATRAGWLPATVTARHVPFGMVLGQDGRPFRTRAGDTVRLTDLLDDAVARARAVVAEKSPDADLDRIAEQAGIGAVKYADLSTSRAKDYVFDLDRMVSLNGNTGVYLQYAHARARSLLRRTSEPGVVDPSLPLAPSERVLALTLDGFAATLTEVTATAEPHRLCGYLYDLARALTSFYEACPVLRAEQPVRGNRIALCLRTADTLREGLGLLGIQAPDRM